MQLGFGGSGGGGIRSTALAQLDVVHVGDDRIGGVRDLAVAVELAHVEGFELLQTVRRRTDPDALLDHRIQIDEHVATQQFVELLLAHSVPRSERLQVRPLVVGVVVDVHARMLAQTLGGVVEEGAQGLLLLGVVVRPERTEDGTADSAALGACSTTPKR